MTPNPSLDLLFRADRLSWDDANRITQPRRRPGGQGINVVRAARALGGPAEAVAVALLGGAVGRELEAALTAEGTALRVVRIAGETRVFVGVREAETGRSLLLNPRGPPGGEAEVEALLEAVRRELASSEAAGRIAWVACCGSLPPGLPVESFARIGALARGRGHRFVPDTDGEALRLAAEEADLLVPNVHEAERLLGRRIASAEVAAEAAAALVEAGPALAVVTMGAEGAVAASKDGTWLAVPDLPASLAA
ncbi:MAG TPA: PfkB family carbohydrate kinase, partial [Gemmatimonadota bacterium]|nr:PfkB family carbohydrate kinase [Gemmatimonadota bacterium]